MAMMECACCKQAVDARSMHTCSGCGSALCMDCADENDGSCPECGVSEKEET